MIKIALAQMDVKWAEPEANLGAARRMVGQAAAEGTDLVVLPELWGSAYDLAHAADYAASLHAGLFGEMAALAREHSLYVAGSLLEEDGGRFYNTCVLYSPQGLVGSYRKLHLIGLMEEDRYLAPGDRLTLCDGLPWGATGLAICYDLRFPELFRALVEKGAEVIVLPAAFTATTGKAHWDTLVKARAIENLCYIAASAQGGYHVNGRETYGHSLLVDPWGKTLDEVAQGASHAIADINLQQLQQLRERFPVLSHRKIS